MKNKAFKLSNTKKTTANLFLIVIAIFTLQTATAQRPEWVKKGDEKQKNIDFAQDFTAEQMATLQTKKMTLLLDLSENQIEKVIEINLKAAKHRKSKMAEMQNKKKQGKPSSEARYKMMISRLDNRIKYKNELAKVLSKEQLEKWQTMTNKNNWESGYSMSGNPNFTRRNN